MTDTTTPAEAEQQLTQALRMVLLAYRGLGFDDSHILGKANLCLQGFVNEAGEFTEEYIALAKEAIEQRRRMAEEDLTPKIITNW
jgi:predicted RNase H-like HicB family nuclease